MEENETNEEELENSEVSESIAETPEVQPESEEWSDDLESSAKGVGEPSRVEIPAKMEIAEDFAAFEAGDLFEEPFKPKPVDTVKNMERLLDVEMNVTVQFGKTEIPLRDAVRFGVGSMIELNRSVDEPVDLLVNNYPFARGEVVVIDGYYGVKITEIGSPEERSQTLLKNSKI